MDISLPCIFYDWPYQYPYFRQGSTILSGECALRRINRPWITFSLNLCSFCLIKTYRYRVLYLEQLLSEAASNLIFNKLVAQWKYLFLEIIPHWVTLWNNIFHQFMYCNHPKLHTFLPGKLHIYHSRLHLFNLKIKQTHDDWKQIYLWSVDLKWKYCIYTIADFSKRRFLWKSYLCQTYQKDYIHKILNFALHGYQR